MTEKHADTPAGSNAPTGASRWDRIVILILIIGCGANLGVRMIRNPLPGSQRAGDAYYYVLSIQSLLEDGDFDLENQLSPNKRYAVSLGADGSFYPKHPVLMPVLSVPFYLLLGRLGCVLFNVLTVLCLGYVVFALAREFASARAARLTAAVFLSIPVCVKYAYLYYPDMLGALLCLLVLLMAVRNRPLAAGLLLGLAMMLRLTNGIMAPLVGSYLLFGAGLRPAAMFALGVFAGLVPLAVQNTAMFGAPWISSYQRAVRMLDYGQRSFEMGDGMGSLFSHKGMPANLLGAFTHRFCGILTTSTQCLIGLVGLACFWRKSLRLSLLLAGIFGGFVLLYSLYGPWAASPYGHRFAFPAIFALCVPCAWFLDWAMPRLSTRAFGALFAFLTIALLLGQVLLNYKFFMA